MQFAFAQHCYIWYYRGAEVRATTDHGLGLAVQEAGVEDDHQAAFTIQEPAVTDDHQALFQIREEELITN